MHLEFLGWEGPLLARAAEWLVQRFGADLSGVLVALPGGRSGRILQEALARAAGPLLDPPTVLTAGGLSDALLEVEGAPASRLVRTLAWERALRQLPPAKLKLLVSRPPGEADHAGWATLADEVRSLFGEIAAENQDFAAVAESPLLADLERERRRWQILGEVQERMSALLAEEGLHDPHLGRREALEAGRVKSPRHVVLVGVVEMNELLRRALELCPSEQTALVFAPESDAAGFDQLGCLRAEAWAERQTSIPMERWHVVDQPDDQARATLRVMRSWKGGFSAEQISIGLADAQVTPYLKRRLEEHGVRARDAAGVALASTGPLRLFAAVAQFESSRSYASFAELVRHPDCESILKSESIEQLDEYYTEHLPWRLDGSWNALGGNRWDQRRKQNMEELWERAQELLGKLLSERSLDLGQQVAELRDLLHRVYGGRELDPREENDRVLVASLRKLATGLSELEEIPPALAPQGPLSETIGRLLRQFASEAVAPGGAVAGEPTIELLGWLELPLDDAPALVVTGFEEGKVPKTVHGDAFLPNTLRKNLELVDNAQRLARDVYATLLLVHSKQEVAFISGRRSLEGEPQLPSRLVFHCDAQEVATRVRRFLSGEPAAKPSSQSEESAARELPRTSQVPAVESMSVSSFKAYLESPYGYYLKHVLRLESVDDEARELDGARFGTLAHEVLERFGKSAVKDSQDAEEIAGFLSRELERVGREIYGKAPLPAVRLQLRQLEHRLGLFAARQAQRRAEGWKIHSVEWSPEAGHFELDVDGEPMKVRGRIDRIDRNEKTGAWAVWDYKTSETLTKPRNAHIKGDGEWRDLQLPLYCLMVKELTGKDYPDELGYISLCRDPKELDFHDVRGWKKPKGKDETTREEYEESAREAMEHVVRGVRAGEFWDAEGWKPYGEIFSAIGGAGLVAAASAQFEESDKGEEA